MQHYGYYLSTRCPQTQELKQRQKLDFDVLHFLFTVCVLQIFSSFWTFTCLTLSFTLPFLSRSQPLNVKPTTLSSLSLIYSCIPPLLSFNTSIIFLTVSLANHPFIHPSFPPLSFLQNLVMFLSLVVAWVIPDVPKTIVEQLKREKKLLVDVFLREEKEKFQLIQSLFSKDTTLPRGSHILHPAQEIPIPGRYSTLPPPSVAGDGGGGPRARCRAASFSQFSRKIPPSPRNENENSKHTAVWHVTHLEGVHWVWPQDWRTCCSVDSVRVWFCLCLLCPGVWVWQRRTVMNKITAWLQNTNSLVSVWLNL